MMLWFNLYLFIMFKRTFISLTGRAKSRLKLQQSIRTTKMLFEWLSVGKQKEKMKQNGTCPCCGKQGVEYQIHLCYHCKNEGMQKAFKGAKAP